MVAHPTADAVVVPPHKCVRTWMSGAIDEMSPFSRSTSALKLMSAFTTVPPCALQGQICAAANSCAMV